MHANIAAYVAALDQCNHRTSVLMQAQPQLPGTLQSLHVRGRQVVLLDVQVDARGQVTRIKVLHSARNRDLDSAAVRAAGISRYSPAMTGCKPQAGDTLFRVVYDPATE